MVRAAGRACRKKIFCRDRFPPAVSPPTPAPEVALRVGAAGGIKKRPLDKFQSSGYNKITGLHFSESQRLTFFRESTVDIFQFVDYSKRVLKEIDFFRIGFLFSCDVFFLPCKPVSFLSIFWAVSLRYTVKV